MSVEAFTRALNAKVGGGTRKLVLLAYANHADRAGRHAWPALATVAEYAEVDVRTAQRAVKALLRDGWLRRGDQELVVHLRADRRPVVYDLAMDDATRALWGAEHRAASAAEEGTDAPARPDNLSPRDESTPVESPTERPDNLSPRSDAHGVTSESPRGDTAVSDEPSRTVQDPPTPSAPSCPAHPDGAPGCRGCGTSPRQLADAAARAKKAAEVEQLKLRQAQAAAARQTRTPRDTATKTTLVADARERIAIGQQRFAARTATGAKR